MKRIDEKVAISGDGAELIQSYLNELNMKLLATGITESYSIVMEAETLFISEINELNKKTKVTVNEVQKIIEKHGTPDEIVQRYKQASEAELEEEFYSIDPTAKELIKRSSNLNSDFQKLKELTYYSLGFITLILPPILYVISLVHLNQFEGNFILFTTLFDILWISDNQSIIFTIVAGILFLTHEVLTSRKGKLFISLRNTIRIRTFNRTVLAAGAFSSFFILRIHRNSQDNDFKGADIPYDESILYVWIIMFIILETVILARDHISTFYPLQPRFSQMENFVKIHYLLLFSAVLFFFLSIPKNYFTLVSLSLVLTIAATLVTLSKNYNPSLRFYFLLQLIPMIVVLMYNQLAFVMYIEFFFIIIVNYKKYHSHLKLHWNNLMELIK